MLETIHFWNRLPSEFGLCSKEQDILYMSAYTLAKHDMKAVEDLVIQSELDKAKNR
jgi:hypothetical protein